MGRQSRSGAFGGSKQRNARCFPEVLLVVEAAPALVSEVEEACLGGGLQQVIFLHRWLD